MGGFRVLTARVPLRDIEARHPALRGAKSPMQTLRIKTASTADERARPGPGRDLPPLLAGAVTAAAGTGVLLALTDSSSPLRGPLALLFLLAAPAAAVAAWLDGLDPFGRVLASLTGAVVLDMLVAQAMLALHQWSVRGGIVAVTTISAIILVLVTVRLRRGRTTRERTV